MICTECDKCFTTKSNLRRHSKDKHHKDTFNIICEHCQKNISRKDNYERHMRSCKILKGQGEQINKKRYTCYKCDKQFIYEIAMKSHLQVHWEVPSGFRTFTCGW